MVRLPNTLKTSVPTRSKPMQTDLPPVSLKPSSIKTLQTDPPTISRKPSSPIKVSAKPTIIRHQSSSPSASISPSNGSNIFWIQLKRWLHLHIPSAWHQASQLSWQLVLQQVMPTNLPSFSLKPSNFELLQTNSPTISRRPSNKLTTSAEPTVSNQQWFRAACGRKRS
jgi:hypothetical protein